MNGEEKLGAFLREVSNWSWEDFCLAENSDDYTSNEAVIFGLIRSAVMQRMDAIRLSLNRLDGKLKTPIRIEYPKIYYLFPNAIALKEGEKIVELPLSAATELSTEVRDLEPEKAEDTRTLDELSLRETLGRMSGYHRRLPKEIIKLAQQTEMWLNKQADEPAEIPRVKSVVAAHLLQMAQSRDIGALTEVFDQLDGKLVETLQILGDDIYITNYSAVAPPGAELNSDGVLQMEAVAAQLSWAEKLKREV